MIIVFASRLALVSLSWHFQECMYAKGEGEVSKGRITLRGSPSEPGREGLLVLLALPRQQREFDELWFPARETRDCVRLSAINFSFDSQLDSPARSYLPDQSALRALSLRAYSVSLLGAYAIKKITRYAHCRSHVEAIMETASMRRYYVCARRYYANVIILRRVPQLPAHTRAYLRVTLR